MYNSWAENCSSSYIPVSDASKKTVLLSGVILLLAILPFVVRARTTQELIPEYIPITEVLPAHEGRIKERVDLLKKQTLEETFVYLLDSQQYSYPGFQSEVKLVPVEIEEILSTRSTLKVFQQFDALPREQAIQKLKVFCTRAIKDFGESLDMLVWRKANPTLEPRSQPINVTGAKYMFCVSLLLAVRAGEYQLLHNQFREMQRIVDTFVKEMLLYDPPEMESTWREIVSFEDDCVLTILMHALKRAGKDTDADKFIKKTIPLCRWDAALTHYDFAVWHGDGKLDPKDIIEQFDVYAFKDRFDVPKKKRIIDTLKERLSK